MDFGNYDDEKSKNINCKKINKKEYLNRAQGY